MSDSQTEQQIICTGSLLTLTVFQEKLMRNFYAINSRLKKLQSISDLQTKTRNVQKQLKFLAVKVDSMVQKLPKEGIAINKKDAQNLIKDQILDTFNNSQDKIKQTQTFKNLITQIQKTRAQLSKVGNKNTHHSSSNQKDVPSKQNSFTAGVMFLSQSKKTHQPSKQLLNEVLTKQQSKIVNQIIQQQRQGMNEFEKVKKDIQKLFQIIDTMKVGYGHQHFVQKQINQYQKFQKQGSRFNQAARKKKASNQHHQAQNDQYQRAIRQPNNQKVGLSKGQISGQIQRNPSKNRLAQITNSKSQTIMKQDLLARKTFNPTSKAQSTLLNKDQYSGVFVNGSTSNNPMNSQQHFNKVGQLTKIQYIPQNKLLSKAQRSKSLRKIDRIQKKLRVDDIKDINSVLKQIQLRLQNKTNHQVFNQFIKQFQQKIQILRITKDSSNEINDLRRIIYNLDYKLQYIISYLQATNNQDEAMIVKKNWTCISCDKNVQKFNGKIGQHLNWDSVQAKKFSPTKIGAFGQTGQLANKIKNLLDNNTGAE